VPWQQGNAGKPGGGAFHVTAEEVEAQSHMGADCSQCHLGDGSQVDKEAAHKGLLKMIVVAKKGLKADPAPRNCRCRWAGRR